MIGAAELQPEIPELDQRLLRFVAGNARDPADSFELAAPVWDLRAYAEPSPLGRAPRVSVGSYGVLTPYLKWFLLERCLLAGRALDRVIATLSAARRAAEVAAELELRSFDDLVSVDLFRRLWGGLVGEDPGGGTERRQGAVWRQGVLRPFFRATRSEFGVPVRLLPRAPFVRPSIATLALDTSKATPAQVTSQLVNRLALHREGRETLDALDHLRLCVVVLHLALGRRISELLAARRFRGPDGPLLRYDLVDGSRALGFRFTPNKGGRNELVYVSPEWEGVVHYTTRELIAYGDAVRGGAEPEARDLLILVSPLNYTSTRAFVSRWSSRDPGRQRYLGPRPRATALRYNSLLRWLNGHPTPESGVMTRWHITASGDPADPPFFFRTHGARHARASALAADRKVSRLAAARDLNQTSRDVVSIYQHGIELQNAELRAKAGRGELLGSGASWIRALSSEGFEAGTPGLTIEDARFRQLLAAQSELVEFNRVEAGYCTRPQGPSACPEFLACTEATEKGCAWFATDPSDERCLAELGGRAGDRRNAADAATRAGHVVLAGKLAVLAQRAERAHEEAQAAAPAAALERLRNSLRNRQLGGDR